MCLYLAYARNLPSVPQKVAELRTRAPCTVPPCLSFNSSSIYGAPTTAVTQLEVRTPCPQEDSFTALVVHQTTFKTLHPQI